MNFFVSDLYKKLKKMQDKTIEMSTFLHDSYKMCLDVAEQTGFQAEKFLALEKMERPEEIDLPERMDYYLAACRISVEAQKGYFEGSDVVALSHAKELCELLPSLLEGCRYYSEWLGRYLRVLASNEKNLFYYTGKMALRVHQAGSTETTLSDLLDRILTQIDEIETELIEVAGESPDLDRDKMERIYYALLSDEIGNAELEKDSALQELDESLMQISEYAPVHQKVRADFVEAVQAFSTLADKYSRSPEATRIRKEVTSNFFEVYEAVAKKCFEDKEPPLAVRLFLWYGYVSEELLTEKELKTLIAQPTPGTSDTEIRVYTMYEWLREIYLRKKKPSKDEFDTDYEEHLRKAVRENSMTEEEMEREMRNVDEMVHFEVENLMKYAERIMAVNRSSYVPVLCSEGMSGRLENCLVTGEAINVEVSKIERMDYSIFYRRYLTYYEEAEISKFEVVTRVLPDFILFPLYGSGGQMWQDMSGRDKLTPGRILLPILIENHLEDDILRLMAHFRWEKCRSEMGAEWNNFHYPSLTSEYTDYLQFYKKNKDLTPERREKVKAQLQQCNNRHREVFAKDYQDWISRELTGSMKLNRVAREILFTYCPPSSEIAGGLLVQNSYQEAGKRYMLEMKKKEKELQGVVRKFEKAGMHIPEEVELTKEFLLNT